MDSLLRWGLENSDADELKQVVSRTWDKDLLDQLLGKDEAVQMKELMHQALDKESCLSTRLSALDFMEMLVESIDNANNIEKLGLWPSILEGLDDQSLQIVEMHLWIIGTALQNNPVSQVDFTTHKGHTHLINLAGTTESVKVANKLMYAVSGLLQNNIDSNLEFVRQGGVQAISSLLTRQDNDQLTRKALFVVLRVLNDHPETKTAWMPFADQVSLLSRRRLDKETLEVLDSVREALSDQ